MSTSAVAKIPSDIAPHKRIYAEAIMQGKNVGEAYKLAWKRPSVGQYEKNRGWKMGKDTEIVEYIQNRHTEILTKEQITTDAIIAKMWKMAHDQKVKCSTQLQALVYLGKYKGLFRDKEVNSEQPPIQIQIINYKDVPENRIRIWRKLSGERHSAIQLQPKAVSGTDVVRIPERSEKDSAGGSQKVGEGSGHMEQGNHEGNT